MGSRNSLSQGMWVLSTQLIQALFNISQVEVLPLTFKAVQKATWNDIILSKYYTKSSWPSLISDVFKPFYTRRHELTTESGCLLWGMCESFPSLCKKEVEGPSSRSPPSLEKWSLSHAVMFGGQAFIMTMKIWWSLASHVRHRGQILLQHYCTPGHDHRSLGKEYT